MIIMPNGDSQHWCVVRLDKWWQMGECVYLWRANDCRELNDRPN